MKTTMNRKSLLGANKIRSKTTATKPLVVNRRDLLMGLACLGVSPNLPAAHKNSGKKEFWLSAQSSGRSDYGFGWVSPEPTSTNRAASGFRGHGSALHPSKPHTALMFARRPGTQAIEVNYLTGEITSQIHCAENYHMFGHGCFSADGSVLFTTENDLKTDQGKLVVRDADNYQVLDEYPSFGIGPHQLMLMPNGKSIVVANGGLLTRPQSGRKLLNPETMDSNLAYVDVANGELVDQIRVHESKASIRHLDVAKDGTVAFAMQMQRQAAGHPEIVPLVATHKVGQPAQLFDQPKEVTAQLQDYVGSVAINNLTRVAGFTSPRGNLAVFWHIDSGDFMGYHKLHDVCGLGISVDQQHFILTSSIGQIRLLDAINLKEDYTKRITTEGVRWDNHLIVATL